MVVNVLSYPGARKEVVDTGEELKKKAKFLTLPCVWIKYTKLHFDDSE